MSQVQPDQKVKVKIVYAGVRCKRHYSPTGSETENTYAYVLDEFLGKSVLKVSGSTNNYKKIQEAAIGTGIYSIIDRFNSGDTSVIGSSPDTGGVVQDFSKFPKTLAEANQLLIDADNYFMSLPLEVRRKYNHDPSDFMKAIDTGEIIHQGGKYYDRRVIEANIKSAKVADKPTAKKGKASASEEAKIGENNE